MHRCRELHAAQAIGSQWLVRLGGWIVANVSSSSSRGSDAGASVGVASTASPAGLVGVAPAADGVVRYRVTTIVAKVVLVVVVVGSASMTNCWWWPMGCMAVTVARTKEMVVTMGLKSMLTVGWAGGMLRSALQSLLVFDGYVTMDMLQYYAIAEVRGLNDRG